jgi:hypothetical protein
VVVFPISILLLLRWHNTQNGTRKGQLKIVNLGFMMRLMEGVFSFDANQRLELHNAHHTRFLQDTLVRLNQA